MSSSTFFRCISCNGFFQGFDAQTLVFHFLPECPQIFIEIHRESVEEVTLQSSFCSLLGPVVDLQGDKYADYYQHTLCRQRINSAHFACVVLVGEVGVEGKAYL